MHPRVFIFASVGARLTDNAGNAQFGQAILQIRVLVNGTPVAGSKTVVTDYDYDGFGDYVVTGGNAVIAGFPVNVTPGNSTTVTLQWAVVRLWSATPWQLRCAPGVGEDHAVLTVLD